MIPYYSHKRDQTLSFYRALKCKQCQAEKRYGEKLLLTWASCFLKIVGTVLHAYFQLKGYHMSDLIQKTGTGVLNCLITCMMKEAVAWLAFLRFSSRKGLTIEIVFKSCLLGCLSNLKCCYFTDGFGFESNAFSQISTPPEANGNSQTGQTAVLPTTLHGKAGNENMGQELSTKPSFDAFAAPQPQKAAPAAGQQQKTEDEWDLFFTDG